MWGCAWSGCMNRKFPNITLKYNEMINVIHLSVVLILLLIGVNLVLISRIDHHLAILKLLQPFFIDLSFQSCRILLVYVTNKNQ